MQPFPVSIERYFFTRFCVISNPDHVPKGVGLANFSVESSLELKQPEDGVNIYIAQQQVKLDATNNPSFPYSLDIECIGFFKAESTLEEHLRAPVILKLAHSVLYASIREAVLIATGRQPWGPLSIGIALLQSGSESTATEKKSKPVAKSKKRVSKVTKLAN